MIPTLDSKNGLSTFLSFGAKSVQPAILEKMLVGRQQTADLLEQYARQIADNGVNNQVFIIGPRGSGKTHLLRVLYHRITDLVHEKRVIVAYFAEEEYGISGYLDFLIRIINAFMRWYDADKPALEAQLNILRETSESRQEYVAEKLISDYVGEKPLLILSENFDSILDALGRNGQGKLRAWLYRHNRISIMATAQATSPDLGREDRPFYGFFSTIKLKKLSYEDSLTLLTTLAETEKNETMLAHLAGKGRGQVRAIHELVKGNHRLLVTFYEFLKADTLADLSVIFMKTMNDLKPYYETFIRFLPAQQQKILHYLALAKIPRQGTDIAKDCFIATTSLSKQLSELQRQHLVDALPDPTDKRNKLYDISEPLLRIAIEIGEQREGITALFIDFMALYYSQDEIKNQKERFEEMIASEVEPLRKQKLFWEVEARERALKMQIELGIKIEDESPQIEEMFRLGDAYYEQDNYWESTSAYKKIIELEPNNANAWNKLGASLYNEEVELANEPYSGGRYSPNYTESIYAFHKAFSIDPAFHKALFNLGVVFQQESRYKQAIDFYKQAIEVAGKEYNYYNNLKEIIIEFLYSKTAFDSALLGLETWLQNRPGFELLATYVNIYRRVIFEKEEKALYELPKEQRIFFEREILKRNAE